MSLAGKNIIQGIKIIAFRGTGTSFMVKSD
jgi:hypothetical protein